MIGIRFGATIGERLGTRVGLVRGAPAEITWTVDATSGGAFPADATEWTDFIAANGTLSAWSAPDSVYSFQQASGTIVDDIGSLDWVSAGARQDFQVTDAAFTRKVARSRGDEWFTTSASLPDANGSSTLMLMVCKFEAADVSTKVILGAASTTTITTLAGGELRLSAAGSTSDGVTNQAGVWIPMITQVNRSSGNSFAATLDTDLTVAHGAISGKQELIAGGSTGASTLFAYAAVWRGAGAERTPAQIKALQQALGFTITWS